MIKRRQRTLFRRNKIIIRTKRVICFNLLFLKTNACNFYFIIHLITRGWLVARLLLVKRALFMLFAVVNPP